MYRNFRSQNFYIYFLSYMDTIIMYCQRLFLLFTFKIFSGDLQALNISLLTKFQVRWCYGFGSTALQQN